MVSSLELVRHRPTCLVLVNDYRTYRLGFEVKQGQPTRRERLSEAPNFENQSPNVLLVTLSMSLRSNSTVACFVRVASCVGPVLTSLATPVPVFWSVLKVMLACAPDADDPQWETEGYGVESCSVSSAIFF